MNPHQKNKIDISSLSPDEQRLFRLYGKLPNKTDLLQNRLKERKYFDSGDYALSKAGKASDAGVTSIGREHPSPETIPHSSSSLGHGHNGSISGGVTLPPPGPGGASGSPVKEGSYLQRETSADEIGADAAADNVEKAGDEGKQEQGTEHAQTKPVMIQK